MTVASIETVDPDISAEELDSILKQDGCLIVRDAINRQSGKIERAINALEGEVESIGDAVDLSTISVGAALGYVDFRLGDMGWRDGHPKLAAWYEVFAKRPSMVGTVPLG